MCFMHNKAAKARPLRSRVDFDRAQTRERIKRPYMQPLYWKWMWSMIRRPGESKMERAAAWLARLVDRCEDAMNLTLW